MPLILFTIKFQLQSYETHQDSIRESRLSFFPTNYLIIEKARCEFDKQNNFMMEGEDEFDSFLEEISINILYASVHDIHTYNNPHVCFN